MTTVDYILIIIAVVIMVVGLILITRGLRNHRNAEQPQATIAEKNGIPIIPRHERNIEPEAELLDDSLVDSESHNDDELSNSEYNQSQRASTNNANTSIDPLNAHNVDQDVEYDYADEHERELGERWRETQQAENNQMLDSYMRDSSMDESAKTDRVSQSQSNEEHDDLFSSFASATESLMPVIETAEEPEFNDNSPMLDQHLLAAADHDQNSPLNHAEENINITIAPHNSNDTIDGSTVLSLVEQYGLKYGAMNMFHRYENKNGTGILWFSMMGITEDGIAPFDLNSLPTTSFNGLVLFLSLPHPKAMQGFDSMMSIVGLIARQLDAEVLDENNEPLTRERRQQLRSQVQQYHAARFNR